MTARHTDDSIIPLYIPGRSIVNTISVGGQPHFIITGPYPPPDVPTPQPTTTSPPHLTLLGLTAALLIGAFAGIGWFIWRKSKSKRVHR